MPDQGPWYCRLCNAQPLMTKGGMRRHYKAHYRLWDPQTDTIVNMNDEERAQQELVKEMRVHVPKIPSASATGASPVQIDRTRHRFMGLRNEPSAACGIPPQKYTSSSEIPSGLDSSEPSVSEGNMANSGPSVRIPTHPKKSATGTRDRRMIIQSPIKLTVPVKGNLIFDPPVDRCPEIEPDQDPGEGDDCVWIEDEPKPKIKNEFQTIKQIAKNPTVDTLTPL